MEVFKIATLSLSGLLLFFVGTMRLINPIKTYFQSSGIKLDKDVNLLNEMRGVGSVMLCGGIIVLLGIIVPSLTNTSFAVACLMFLGFAIGRFVSIAVVGKPNKQILQGIVFELVLGSANVVGLVSTST